ncbi:EthD domain-containing protein [Nocardioides sp.]|uniref:EthD domain-containing protein n=1 Tax=Nocardioides sp. TaxID=35761 RepID=UPI00356443A5
MTEQTTPATKLMFLLWGADLGVRLHDPVLLDRLASVGVQRVQLNLDDAPVADALRLQTFADPVGAVLSAWTSQDARAVQQVLEDALAGTDSRVAGYRVEERRPLDPPESYDGSRADTLANVAVLRRPDELSREEWLHRWLEQHTPVAIETQATFGYLQNIVIEPLTSGAPRVDALVEELFPSAAIDDMHAFYGSGGDDEELGRRITRLMESVARIGADRDLDLMPSSRYLFDLV